MQTTSIRAIRRHYDWLSLFYQSFWGEHIHHGFWHNGESPREAQRNLVEELARRSAIQRGATVLDIGCGLGASAIGWHRNSIAESPESLSAPCKTCSPTDARKRSN